MTNSHTLCAVGRSPATRHLSLLLAPSLPADHLLRLGGGVLTLRDLSVMASAGRLPPGPGTWPGGDLPKMAATEATARRGRGSASGGGAVGRRVGLASGLLPKLAAPARLRGAALRAVRLWRGKAPVGPTGTVRKAEASGLAPAARRRYRRHSPASLGFGAPVVGARVPQHTQLQQLRSLCPVLRKPRRQPGPLAGRMTELQSALLLRRQLAELNKNPVEGFSAGLIDDNDLYRWEVLIIGPPDTLYEGGVFKAHLTFPKDYPLRPPKMKFITEIWHPNVDKNGDVCISILHEPGEDKYGYEKPEERWLPIHTVETIMISVISMLADPNGDSPANVDAAKEWREDRNGEFKRKVARCVRKSQETAFE
ncbi:ubiquitin-conjugating enzyme E2 G1 [Budorcas taxicolor]|uniref:ubiquitin-conjugating enzyme E2 G1 n=1 Tax=Budorcas taxicolor TaxID=37181 RepID=UPI002283A93E|nr:ubiquitin-conjugating enzyme E2 G1 [Budorcas taxicolor]